MMKVTKGGLVGRTPVQVTAVICVLVLLYHGFSGRSAKEPTYTIGYPEAAVTNTHRGVSEMCQSIDGFNDSATMKVWETARINANKMPFKPENVPQKLRLAKVTGDAPKVLCLVVAMQTRPRIGAQYETWGRRCDRFHAFGNTTTIEGVPNEMVTELHPTFGDNDNNMWQKMRSVFRELRQWDLSKYDYTYVASDSAYFIPNNFKRMVMEPHFAQLHKLGAPMLLGHRMVSEHEHSAFVSGAGYALNSVALKMMTVYIDSNRCKPDIVGGAADVLLSKCFMEFDLQVLNTADHFDEDRMHCFGPTTWGHSMNANNGFWYAKYRMRPLPKGLSVLSVYTASINYVEPREAYAFSEHLYPKGS